MLSRSSASVAEFEAVFGLNVKNLFLTPLKMKENNESLLSGEYYMDHPEELATHLDLYGWGTLNGEFICMDLEPDTEYVVAYIGITKNLERTNVRFTESFRTKELIWADCNKSDLKLEISDVTNSSYKLTYTYDSFNTAVVHSLIYYPDNEDWDIFGKDVSQSDLWEIVEENRSNVYSMKRVVSGVDSSYIFDYDGTRNEVIIYWSEDMDGVVGDIKFVTVE